MANLNCPQCGRKLGEVPKHLLVDQFQNYCDDCEEFVTVSAVRQLQQNQSEVEVSFGETEQ